MMLSLSGTKIELIIDETMSLMKSLSKWARLMADAVDKKTPQTGEEMEKDMTLSALELDLRERRARVEMLELDARERVAQAVKAEADYRLRSAAINNGRLSRTNHKTTHAPKTTEKVIGPLPTMESLKVLEVKPAVKEERRSDEVRGSSEGKSLTFSLGDKLKPSTPS